VTRINNAEQVLLLLRMHLQRAQRQRKQDAPGAPARMQARQGPLQRVRELASLAGVSDADLTRALIAGLLAEEFGADIANDAHFQTMVDDVRRIIDADESTSALLKNALTQLARDGG
jgi:hypothetical protein